METKTGLVYIEHKLAKAKTQEGTYKYWIFKQGTDKYKVFLGISSDYNIKQTLHY